MELIKILESTLDYKEKESKISALFRFNPPPEEKREEKGDYYQGLAAEALSTSFEDYYQLYKEVDQELIDYGSAYSKGSILFQALGNKRCYSYEYLASRVEYTKNLCQEACLDEQYIIKRDLLTSDIPLGPAYLIYLPLGDIFFRLIQALYQQERRAAFYIIESHGDFLDYVFSLKAWFKFIKKIESSTPRHTNGIYHFEFCPNAVNEDNLLYQYVLSYGEEFKFEVNKDDTVFSINLNETLPIKYNGKMAIEAFKLKRIIDNKIILLQHPHQVIGE